MALPPHKSTDPRMPPTAALSLADAATIASNGLHALEEDRNRLRELSHQLETENLDLTMRLNYLEAKLKEVTDSRDSFMRFSVELTTNLNTVSMIIQDCFSRATARLATPVEETSTPFPPPNLDLEEKPALPKGANIAQFPIEMPHPDSIPEFLTKGPAV